VLCPLWLVLLQQMAHFMERTPASSSTSNYIKLLMKPFMCQRNKASAFKCISPSPPCLEKAWQIQCNVICMSTVLTFMKLCTTKSFHRHKHLCGLLQQAVWQKQLEKWHNGDWFHYYHTVPAHPKSLQEFLDNNGKTINLHPLDSLDVASSEFFLFPK